MNDLLFLLRWVKRTDGRISVEWFSSSGIARVLGSSWRATAEDAERRSVTFGPSPVRALRNLLRFIQEAEA